MTVRFHADLPYDKWPAVNAVFDCMRKGDWVGARAAFDARPQDVTDSIGSGNMWRDKFVPVTPAFTNLGSINKYETTQWFLGNPGEIYAITATADGRISNSNGNGGDRSYGTLDINTPAEDWEAKAGGVTMLVKAGQTLYAKFDGPPQQLRFSLN